MTSWIGTRARRVGAEVALADRRLLLAAAASAVAGAVYVMTASDLALATSAIAACLCALLGRAER